MTVRYTVVELMRLRLTPGALQQSALLAETFDPPRAVAAGYLDRLEPDLVVERAREAASGFPRLDASAHRATKSGFANPLSHR